MYFIIPAMCYNNQIFLFCIFFLPVTAYLPILYTLDFTLPDAPVYQAASPDEEALVSAARELGWVFLSRTRDSVVVSELGVTRRYQLLALLEFSSQRRCMSVLGQSHFSATPKWANNSTFLNHLHFFSAYLQACLYIWSSCTSLSFPIVREPGGEIMLYSKGADLVILERLQRGYANQERIEAALEV